MSACDAQEATRINRHWTGICDLSVESSLNSNVHIARNEVNIKLILRHTLNEDIKCFLIDYGIKLLLNQYYYC